MVFSMRGMGNAMPEMRDVVRRMAELMATHGDGNNGVFVVVAFQLWPGRR